MPGHLGIDVLVAGAQIVILRRLRQRRRHHRQHGGHHWRDRPEEKFRIDDVADDDIVELETQESVRV